MEPRETSDNTDDVHINSQGHEDRGRCLHCNGDLRNQPRVKHNRRYPDCPMVPTQETGRPQEVLPPPPPPSSDSQSAPSAAGWEYSPGGLWVSESPPIQELEMANLNEQCQAENARLSTDLCPRSGAVCLVNALARQCNLKWQILVSSDEFSLS
ncbi:hypothetical protein ACOMHN_059611 [Nucella lapillus]